MQNANADKKRVKSLLDFYDLPFGQQEKVSREFWIQKLGYYPAEIAKVARVVSFEQANREKEDSNKELEAFIQTKDLWL